MKKADWKPDPTLFGHEEQWLNDTSDRRILKWFAAIVAVISCAFAAWRLW